MTAQRAGLAGLFARYRARRLYFAAQDEAVQAWAEFTETGGSWVARWEALALLADCERTMAHTAFGFSRSGVRDHDGFTVAESHDMAAGLVELVADTEIATMSDETDTTRPVWSRHGSTLVDDPQVATVLTRLSTQDQSGQRAELVLALYDAVIGRVGGQGAEVLAWVACGYFVLSGMSLAEAQWRTGPKLPEEGDRS